MDPPLASEMISPLHLSINKKKINLNLAISNWSNWAKSSFLHERKIGTLIISAIFQMLIIPSLALSADGHRGSLKFGSYDKSTPASFAALVAATCADLHGSVMRLMDP